MTALLEAEPVKAPIASSVPDAALQRPDVHVETAVAADEEQVMELCRLLHAENAMFGMSEAKVRFWMRKALAKDHGIVGVIRVDDRIVGAVCLLLDCFWYTDDIHLEEFFNFVHPDHRASNYAGRLIDFAKEVSDRLKYPLFIGIISTIRTESKIRLYTRKLIPAGAFFIFNKDLVDNNLETVPPDLSKAKVRGSALRKRRETQNANLAEA